MLPADILEVCSNYYCMDNVSNIVAEDVISNFARTNQIIAPDLSVVRAKLASNPQLSALTEEVLRKYNRANNIDMSSIKQISDIFGVKSVLLISSSGMTKKSNLRRRVWEILDLSNNFDIVYPFEMETNAVLIDSVNGLVMWSGSYKRKLGKLAGIRGADVCMKLIEDTEYLKRAIGYVLRNPLSAGLKILPIHYEWSSASLYFRSPAQTDFRNLRTVGALSYREKRNLLHSQTNELDTYTITPEGMIGPESYVAVQAVEELFYSPARLMYFISSKENMEVEIRSGILHKARYTDDELIISIGNICQEVFVQGTRNALHLLESGHH